VKQAAIYARVSTAGQEERHTIESQLVACREYAEHQGYDVVGEFKDDGVSGAVPFDERPEGARLLEMAQEGLFDRVVIYTVDRLGRDTSEGIIAVRRLRKVKVEPDVSPRMGIAAFPKAAPASCQKVSKASTPRRAHDAPKGKCCR
jgi:site-specific DNA recombinase